jgi:hypothetical protein
MEFSAGTSMARSRIKFWLAEVPMLARWDL